MLQFLQLVKKIMKGINNNHYIIFQKEFEGITMSLFKCKMCGGNLQISENTNILTHKKI